MPQSVDNNVVMTVIQQLLGRLKLIDNGKRHGLVQKWIKELGIKVFDLGSPVQNLSGGNQQRVVIAKWLATNPQILILDGPTVGIDIAAKSSIHSMIRDLANSGVGIILISDEVPEVMNNCNRILLMKNGRIINQFDTSKVTEEAIQTSIESS